MPTRYFLFLTNCYHQPPQAASEKHAEPMVAAVGVSHSPVRRGKLLRTPGPKEAPRYPQPALPQS